MESVCPFLDTIPYCTRAREIKIKSQGSKLAAGFSLNMGSKNMSKEKQQKLLRNQKKKVELVSGYVNVRKKGDMNTWNIT